MFYCQSNTKICPGQNVKNKSEKFENTSKEQIL